MVIVLVHRPCHRVHGHGLIDVVGCGVSGFGFSREMAR